MVRKTAAILAGVVVLLSHSVPAWSIEVVGPPIQWFGSVYAGEQIRRTFWLKDVRGDVSVQDDAETCSVKGG